MLRVYTEKNKIQIAQTISMYILKKRRFFNVLVKEVKENWEVALRNKKRKVIFDVIQQLKKQYTFFCLKKKNVYCFLSCCI